MSPVLRAILAVTPLLISIVLIILAVRTIDKG